MVEIYDTSLAQLNIDKEKKAQIVEMLDKIGVSKIDVGSPETRKKREVIRYLLTEPVDAEIFASVYREKDVEKAVRCDVDGVTIPVPASGRVARILELNFNKMIKSAHESGLCTYATLIDATYEGIESRISGLLETGVDCIILEDTASLLTPEKTEKMFKELVEKYGIKFGISAKNGFGMSVANTISAIKAGVNVVFAAIYGKGFSHGNTPLEDLVLALNFFFSEKRSLESLSRLLSVFEKRIFLKRYHPIENPLELKLAFENREIIFPLKVSETDYMIDTDTLSLRDVAEVLDIPYEKLEIFEKRNIVRLSEIKNLK